MRPLFQGKIEAEQFDFICKIIGTPTDTTWCDIFELPNAASMLMSCSVYSTNLQTSCGGSMPPVCVDLLERLLCADPSKRCSARLALGNRYFVQTQGRAGDADALRLEQSASFHEFQTKKRKFDAMRNARDSGKASAASSGGMSIGTESTAPSSIEVAKKRK